MSKKTGLSIRYKLLLVLTTLPVITLATYIALALRIFESDKLAYVFDSSVSVARTSASQVKAAIYSVAGTMNPIVQGYNPFAKKFNRQSESLFERDEKILRISVYGLDQQSGDYIQKSDLTKDGNATDLAEKQDKGFKSFLAEIRDKGIALKIIDPGTHKLLIGVRYGELAEPDHLLAVSLARSVDFFEVFEKASNYSTSLVDLKGSLLATSTYADPKSQPQFDKWEFFTEQKWKNIPEGTAEIQALNEELLASYSGVGVGDLFVLTYVNKKEALNAVFSLIRKSVYFFVALICATLIFSVFASNRLTSALRDLFDATRRIAEGNFDIRVDVETRDEVGSLAEGFNTMAGEVSRLMAETAEKARMAAELETAKTVQETLFPATRARIGPVQISGHFEPASECGGDWWYYNDLGEKVWVWLGDATGHGAGAALITSAAKSAASIIERLPDITPDRAMELLNRAIFETSKGGMMMTFFLASFEKSTGLLTYCNASHDPPYLMKSGRTAELKKRDLIPLMDVNNSRLGDKLTSKYKQAQVQLKPGDRILFYTDGIMDVQNQNGDQWGERKFIRAVLEGTGKSLSVDETVSSLLEAVNGFRQSAPLIDDITFFFCEYDNEKKAA